MAMIVAACSLFSTDVVPAARAQTESRTDLNQLFRRLLQSDTIQDRQQICSEVDPRTVPPYVGLFCQGYQALAIGSDSLAVRLLSEALDLQPNFAVACLAYADAFAEREQWEPAAFWYETASKISPMRLDPYYGLGRVWLARAQAEGTPAYEKALAAFEGMTHASPSNPDGWSNMGMVLALLGRYGEAETHYREALRLTPKDPEIHYSLGSLASRRGDDATAEAEWKKTLELAPAYGAAAVELASLYGRQGRLQEASSVLENAVDDTGGGPDAARLRRDLGLLVLRSGKADRAVSLVEQAKMIHADPRTLVVYAHMKLLQGKTEAALSALAEAARQDTAAAGPMIRQWAPTLQKVLLTFGTSDPVGATAIRSLFGHADLQREVVPEEASLALIDQMLPGWRIPAGKLEVKPTKPEREYDTPPSPVYRPPAFYPETAMGIEGTVIVKLRVDTRGIVKDAKVLEGGNPALEWAALDAAKRWRFDPAKLDGKPVEADVTIPFKFTNSPTQPPQ
ncbi:MAG: TonB family protein [Candidatus Eisenbacteria bacterium]|nr:TonB family protein [Candidatus Eisenbacteria bacterium]